MKNIITIQEETELHQDGKTILLEKGDMIEVLDERADVSDATTLMYEGLGELLKFDYIDPPNLFAEGKALAEAMCLAVDMTLSDYIGEQSTDEFEKITKGAYTTVDNHELVPYIIRGMMYILKEYTGYYSN